MQYLGYICTKNYCYLSEIQTYGVSCVFDKIGKVAGGQYWLFILATRWPLKDKLVKVLCLKSTKYDWNTFQNINANNFLKFLFKFIILFLFFTFNRKWIL